MKRDIVKIDETLCNGCGECVPNCHEGALQIIDGKAILISDLMCDGLGACLGHCPMGAITIEQRDAEPYDETKVIAEMVKKGENVVKAHLLHLKEHKEYGFLAEAVKYLQENKNNINFNIEKVMSEIHNHSNENAKCGCPSAKEISLKPSENNNSNDELISSKSELINWPVQMHLINPSAGYFKNSDIVVSADCVAFSLGNFHSQYLKGKTLVIACPKLDSNTEIYIEKFKKLIEEAKVNTITIMIMEVPCCSGLLQMVKTAVDSSTRKVPVKLIVVGINGEIKKEEWV